jgi:hypothetical protein
LSFSATLGEAQKFKVVIIIQFVMGKVIIPKTYVKDIEAPLIFLAGPVKGAPNWQDEAIIFLLS